MPWDHIKAAANPNLLTPANSDLSTKYGWERFKFDFKHRNLLGNVYSLSYQQRETGRLKSNPPRLLVRGHVVVNHRESTWTCSDG